MVCMIAMIQEWIPTINEVIEKLLKVTSIYLVYNFLEEFSVLFSPFLT